MQYLQADLLLPKNAVQCACVPVSAPPGLLVTSVSIF